MTTMLYSFGTSVLGEIPPKSYRVFYFDEYKNATLLISAKIWSVYNSTILSYIEDLIN